MISGYMPPNPHQVRWMAFVDGENFTIRGQELARQRNFELQEGDHYIKDTFLWMPGVEATRCLIPQDRYPLQNWALRAHYFASVQGDDAKLKDVQTHLWELGFDPHVFKRERSTARTKAVDIALATCVLSNAYAGNFDAAVLYAGDGDYVPLVEELKHAGKIVHVAFYAETGLSPRLRLAADTFHHFSDLFEGKWTAK